jgi:formylmethanofuran dehydrogenase subunit E
MSQLQSLSNEDYERRKKLWESIKSLGRPEQEELFRIIRREGVEFSENTNGVFFDISKISETTLEQIEKFIQFCRENREAFTKRDEVLAILRSGTV